MLLGEVWRAMPSWQKLSGMRMRPKVAYKILRYARDVSAEHDVAEKQRVALIHEVTNTREGEDAKIEPDTPQFAEYVQRFNEIMATECDLKPLNRSLEQILDSVGEDQDNVLSTADLAMLEPFFVAPSEQPVEPPMVAGKIG